METLEIKCGGFCIPPKFRIPAESKFRLDQEVNRQRAAFRLEHEKEFGYQGGKYEDGPRFRENGSVYARIESAAPFLLHFEANEPEWIQAALDDCGQADYWYQHEKEYDDRGNDNPADDGI